MREREGGRVMKRASAALSVMRIEKEDIMHHGLNRAGTAFLCVAFMLGALAGCTTAGTAPAAPTDVTAVAGDSSVTISWTAAANATSYNVYWLEGSSVTTGNGTKVSDATSPDTVSGLANGTGYAFIVTAVNSAGESAASSVSMATPAAHLYMTDTFSGKVYTYTPNDRTVSSTSLVSTGQNSTGAIFFYKGTGYIAVGSYSNTAPGVYCFNPSDSYPKAVQIGSNVSAQCIAFYSATKAYVSVADYTASGTHGVYTFNPSNPSAGLTGPISGTALTTMYLQQIVVGPDNMIYVADNYNQKVDTIDPSTDTLSATAFTASASGTTALASGSYNGTSGVFVGNITYSNTGSIDFINTSAASISTVLSSVDVSRILCLSSDRLATTGSKSYLVSGLSTGSPAKTELGSSLGGADVAAKDGMIYVGWTDYSTSKLYVFDSVSGAAESYSPVPAMGSGECVAGIAFYQD
jgi:hypothetical protein